jgi:mannosyltransferase OCH1-like enzyme
MIPKIIHYTWFSNEEYPDTIKECILSWHKYMPEYEFVLWDMRRIKDIPSTFLKESLEERKWAFASDYVRLYAVYNYGGIYLDTDVLVYKSFDSLLNNSFFIGKENSWHIHGNGHDTMNYLSSHCFGSEKNHIYLKECLDYYNYLHFIKTTDNRYPNELKYDMTIQPYIQAVVALKYGYKWLTSEKGIQQLSSGIIVYPSQYFDAISLNDNTFCKHLALGGWRSYSRYNPEITWKYKIVWRLKNLIEKILNKFSYTMVKLT